MRTRLIHRGLPARIRNRFEEGINIKKFMVKFFRETKIELAMVKMASKPEEDADNTCYLSESVIGAPGKSLYRG